jgi:hypothetical protein
MIQKPKFMIDEKNPHIGGIADGLIDEQTGLEIKCHISDKNLLIKLPLRYLIQMTGYMYLYKRMNWTLMSCIFNDDHTVKKYTTHVVGWSEVKDRWEREWYPQIVKFVNEVKWMS